MVRAYTANGPAELGGHGGRADGPDRIAVTVENVDGGPSAGGTVTALADEESVSNRRNCFAEEAIHGGRWAYDRRDKFKFRPCLGYHHRHGRTQESHIEEELTASMLDSRTVLNLLLIGTPH